MATTKCTMLFQLLTGGAVGNEGARIGGWSESWYSDEAISTLPNTFGTLCLRRAAMLPTQAAIIGQRYQQVVPHVKSSQVAAVTYAGASSTNPDIPQMAMLCKVGAQAPNPNIRSWAMRGIPDARVVNGEYVPSAAFTLAFDLFKNFLQVFQFRARNLLADQAAINFVDATGDVWLNSPLTVAPNTLVQIIKGMNTEGRQVGGVYQVETAPNSSNFQLRNYDLGLLQGGTVRVYEIIYPQVDPVKTQLGRITVRKVGRPFFSYRGRRSNRR